MRLRRVWAVCMGGLVMATASPALAGGNELSGKNACTVGSGAVTFSPALRRHGDGQPSYVFISLHLSSCSRAAARRGTFKGKPSFHLADDSCASLFAPPPAADGPAGTIWWAPSRASRSTDLSFTGRSESARGAVRFKLTGGQAYGGSFDGGALAAFTVRATRAQISETCRSSKGLGRLVVKSGSVKVGPGY